MSWDEIKKAVNSDIQVPLNEKIEYVYGVVPRGIKKHITKKSVTESSYNGVIVSITGKGVIHSAAVSVTSTNLQHYEKLQIVIDGDKTITIGEAVFSYSKNTNASLTYVPSDMLSTIPPDDFPMTVLPGKAETINKPIFFEESLTVEVSLNMTTNNQASSASITYGLLP